MSIIISAFIAANGSACIPPSPKKSAKSASSLFLWFHFSHLDYGGAAATIAAPHRNGWIQMQNKETFSSYHPVINFLYFGLVLAFTMFFMHPACLAISLISAVLYSIRLRGKKAVRFSLFFMLPMMLLAAVINPAFNHEGVTLLAYLPSGNPLTLESIAYGIAAAAMLASVVIWFTCYNEIMTSDKFVYLFGRVIPALSLVLSMTLRFVPRFTAQIKMVSEAQRCVGRDVSEGSLLRRVKNGITILSIMVTWSLENAIETADSMKSRGYGLKGRTAFSIYRFDRRDKSVLLWLLFCGLYVLSGWLVGGVYWRYYPSMKGIPLSPFPISFMLIYLALCLTPGFLDVKEDRAWIRLQSKT
jgi:energy-coupling factor transport system permease protein